MQMGIERVLKEKFGDAIKDIRQVYDEEVKETTAEVRREWNYYPNMFCSSLLTLRDFMFLIMEISCFPVQIAGGESSPRHTETGYQELRWDC